MFFLDDVERKYLRQRLLPLARKVGVPEELRGWSWDKTPLKPFYEDVKIPMYSVTSKYCPTGRDVYVNRVEGVKGVPGVEVMLGAAVHRTVSDRISQILDDSELEFDEWYEKVLREKHVDRRIGEIESKCRIVWDYLTLTCKSRLESRSSRQPYSTSRDIKATSIPLLVEHKLNGELLGLSGILSVDAYDYLHNVVFDLKISAERRDWYRLAPTGYALVLESIYEVPVDIGCVSYVTFRNNRLIVQKDLFYINSELRSWWIEERDTKLEIVAQRKDPGIPRKCPENCIYRQYCKGESQ